MMNQEIANIVLKTPPVVTVNTFQYSNLCNRLKEAKETKKSEEVINNQKQELIKNLVAILKYYKDKVDTEMIIQGKIKMKYMQKCLEEIDFLRKITGTVDSNLFDEVVMEVFK